MRIVITGIGFRSALGDATTIGVVLLGISLILLIGINILQAWGQRYED